MKFPKGYFLTIEGGEGVGKSTLVERITSLLENQGHDVVYVRAPGGTPFAEDMRTAFKTHYKAIDGFTQAGLMAAAIRDQIVNVIIPALTEGKVVIADRFYLSTYVYQGVIAGVGVESIRVILSALGVRLAPHRMIALTCDPAVSAARIQVRKDAGGEFDSALDTVDVRAHERYNDAYIHCADILNTAAKKNGSDPAVQLLDTTSLTPDEIEEQVMVKVTRDLAQAKIEHITVETHAH